MPKVLNLSLEEKRQRLNIQKMNWYYKNKRNSYKINHKKKLKKVLNELKFKYYLKRNINLTSVKRKRRYCLKRIQQLKEMVETYDRYIN